MSVLALNLSHIYETGILPGNVKILDFTDIPGTDCYCDDRAKEIIRDRLSSYGPEGVHFLDSGNYHYLTLFFLEKIPKDQAFDLILFDNHPDSQAPAFGEITSCGGWVREAWIRFPNLRRVILAGADPGLVREEGLDVVSDALLLEGWNRADKAMTRDTEEVRPIKGIEKTGEDRDRFPVYVYGRRSQEESLKRESSPIPVYISIDKDVLSTEDAACSWSQGRMGLSDLQECLEAIPISHPVIGVDVCGEEAYPGTDPGRALNAEADRRILSFMSSWWSQ